MRKNFCKIGFHSWKETTKYGPLIRGCKHCDRVQVLDNFLSEEWLETSISLHKEILISILKKLEVIK